MKTNKTKEELEELCERMELKMRIIKDSLKEIIKEINKN
jgi:hypothetical protein